MLTAQGFNAMRRHEVIGAAASAQGHRSARRSSDRQREHSRARAVSAALLTPRFIRTRLPDALTAAKPKRVFEYWGHEASLLPIDCQPLLRWRMARALPARGCGGDSSPTRRRSGARPTPCSPASSQRGRWRPPMWRRAEPEGHVGWSAAKHALEWLFWAGARRRDASARQLRARLRPARAGAAPARPPGSPRQAALTPGGRCSRARRERSASRRRTTCAITTASPPQTRGCRSNSWSKRGP